MKRSNLLLCILSALFLTGIFLTDKILAIQYTKINLSDPYKNFAVIPVKPFKALKISGGNGYAIRITQDSNYNIRLLHSRKSFFKMDRSGDTLSVTFSVANQNYQKPEQSTVGLIIFVPMIRYLQLSGTNNELLALRQDSLIIKQDTNTVTRVKDLQANYLNLSARSTSYVDLQSNNSTSHLEINLEDNARIDFHDISFNTFTPLLKNSASMTVYRKSLQNITAKQIVNQR